MIKRCLLVGIISAVVPFLPAISQPVTSQEYKYEINFAEAKTAIRTHCIYQFLGFTDAERAQEFTSPYLTNRVKNGDLKPGDPLRIYQWLDTYDERNLVRSLDQCPGVIDVDILEGL